MDVAVTWKLIEAPSGVNLTQDGKLTIPKQVTVDEVIKLQVEYQDLVLEFEISLFKVITFKEVQEDILNRHKSKISNILG